MVRQTKDLLPVSSIDFGIKRQCRITVWFGLSLLFFLIQPRRIIIIVVVVLFLLILLVLVQLWKLRRQIWRQRSQRLVLRGLTRVSRRPVSATPIWGLRRGEAVRQHLVYDVARVVLFLRVQAWWYWWRRINFIHHGGGGGEGD